MFEAPSYNSFQDILITNFQSPNLQRKINRKKMKLENVFMKHYAPNYMLASEQNIHVSDVTEKGDNSVMHQQNFTKS